MGAEQERVAVTWLRQHIPGGDHAGRDRLVLHDHALPQHLAELVRHEAGRNVGRSAGAETDHQPDRLCGIRLLRRCGRETRDYRKPVANRSLREIHQWVSWPSWRSSVF